MMYPFILQRSGRIIPNEQGKKYHDLMVTFENAFLVAVKYQINDPKQALYLFLCGTDPLDRLFGNVRIKFGVNGVDHLGLAYAE